MNKFVPFKFQADTDAWLATRRTHNQFTCDPNCGLIGHEMGLGKTAIALRRIKGMVARGKRFLILAPGATIVQWQRSWDWIVLDNETDDFGLASLFAVSSSTQKLPTDSSIIASHTMLAKADFVEQLIKLNFDGLILDEAHKFGNKDAKRLKHLLAVRNCSQSKFSSARILLTGTPVRNYADEIYTLLHIVAPSCFRNPEDFARRYLTYDRRALWNPGQFHSDIKPFYLRYTVAEVQKDLPPSRKTKLYCEVTDRFLKQAYNKQVDALTNFMERGSMLRGSKGEEDAGPQSLLGYLVRLRHITSLVKTREQAIIEPLVDYLLSDNQMGLTYSNGDAVNGNKLAIGLIHKQVAINLERNLKHYVPNLQVFHVRGGMTAFEKDQAVQLFQSCNAPAVILCNMEAGGAGIDGLQNACCRATIFERMWNGADEEQFEKRIVRTGQKFACEHEYAMAKGTIDEYFDALVERKRQIAGEVSDGENWEQQPFFIKELAKAIVAGGHI